MSTATYVTLADRGVLSVSGEDARTFLQGLISNDINKVTPERAIHAALLTPQGKYLHDFFIVQAPDGRLLIDCERERLPDLQKRLKMFKLRAKADLDDVSDDWTVVALPGTDGSAGLGLGDDAGMAKATDGGGVAYVDPRLAAMGARAILPAASADAFVAGLKGETDRTAYDRLRLSLGLPDGTRDMIVDKSILLESGFDELNGVDWNKGCYMGQELTARTKYRGLIKKRLMPVEIEGAVPEAGTPLILNGKDVGEIRSTAQTDGGGLGLALVRLETLEDGATPTFEAGDARVTPRKPDWATF
ncbi:MAG TPA: folate-binding protein [Rhodospirillaceae bacterium]|nr:folate-binding protein [Rhodospirillaceae bacterium]